MSRLPLLTAAMTLLACSDATCPENTFRVGGRCVPTREMEGSVTGGTDSSTGGAQRGSKRPGGREQHDLASGLT